jgi:hypothetical protein
MTSRDVLPRILLILTRYLIFTPGLLPPPPYLLCAAILNILWTYVRAFGDNPSTQDYRQIALTLLPKPMHAPIIMTDAGISGPPGLTPSVEYRIAVSAISHRLISGLEV